MKQVIRLTENDLKRIVTESVNRILGEYNYKSPFHKRRAAIATRGRELGKSPEEIRQDILNDMAKTQALKDINKDRSIQELPTYDRMFQKGVTNQTFDIDFSELNDYDPYYDDFSNIKPMNTSAMASRNPNHMETYADDENFKV